jgi:hypothetical protein
MKSIKSADSRRKKKNISKRTFQASFTLLLIVFVFTMSSPSFFQMVNPVMAAGLTSVSVVPMTGIVNQRTTYDIFLKTATTATIKTIEMTFPPSFDLTFATKLIEREGIGFGSFSASGSTLTYKVKNPVSVSAGTTIRLELARIVAGNAGSFTVSVRTLNTANSQIDGPTSSFFFSIKDIGINDIAANSVTSSKIANNSITSSKIVDDSVTSSKIANNSITSSKIVDDSVTSSKIVDDSIRGDDVSTGFMIRKTMQDDTAGHAHGWNPDASTTAYAISDSDISGSSSSEFVSVMVRSGNPTFCAAASGDAGVFGVYCNSPPGNSAELDYIITNLPPHDVTSSLSTSSSEYTPSSESPSPSSFPHTSVLPDIASINRQDDIASEFP